MKMGFLWHSPTAAHLVQFSSSSVQSPSSNRSGTFSLLTALTWKNLVAHHISPSMTGHLAWGLLLSGDAFRWLLKNSIAFPLVGLSMELLFLQSDHILLSTWEFSNCWSQNIRILLKSDKNKKRSYRGFLMVCSHLWLWEEDLTPLWDIWKI